MAMLAMLGQGVLNETSMENSGAETERNWWVNSTIQRNSLLLACLRFNRRATLDEILAMLPERYAALCKQGLESDEAEAARRVATGHGMVLIRWVEDGYVDVEMDADSKEETYGLTPKGYDQCGQVIEEFMRDPEHYIHTKEVLNFKPEQA